MSSVCAQVDHRHALGSVLLPGEGLVDPGDPGQGPVSDAVREPAAGRVPPQVPALSDRGQRDGPGEQRLGSGPRHHLRVSGAGGRGGRVVRPGSGLLPPSGRRLVRGGPHIGGGEQLERQRRSDAGLPAQPEPGVGAAVGRGHDCGDSDRRGPDLHRGMLQTVPGCPAGPDPSCTPGGSTAVRELRPNKFCCSFGFLCEPSLFSENAQKALYKMNKVVYFMSTLISPSLNS